MAWHSAITTSQLARIERVQKVAFRLIFGKGSYRQILEGNRLQTLEKRRTSQCLKFATKALAHKKFKQWFKPEKIGVTQKRSQFAPTIARQKRLIKSPLPYLTNLLNTNNGGN